MAMRRLIINADDLGLSPGVNEGILDAHTTGIVTSASLMVLERAAESAVDAIGGYHGLSVGLHFVDDCGTDLDDPGQTERSFDRQLERFRKLTGRDPTHLDSHHHLHTASSERLATFAGFAKRLGVPLRGHGPVSYVGAFWAQWRPGVSNLRYVGSAFLLDDVIGGGQVNHVWWSVALEWQIYLVFPLLVVCWLRFGVLRAALLGGLIAAVAAAVVDRVPQVGQVNLAGLHPWFLALFAFGMLGAAICTGSEPRLLALRDRARWGVLTAVAVAAVVAVCATAGRAGTLVAHPAAIDLLVGAAALCALVASSRPRRSRLRRFLSGRAAVALGGCSYSLYLIHAPLLQVEWQYVVNPLGLGPLATFMTLAVLGVPLVVAASYLFFLAFERPFLSRSRRKRHPVRVPVAASAGMAVSPVPTGS